MTVVVQARLLLFGDVVDGEMRLNQAGAMVTRVWEEMPDRFPNIEIDAFVVMPNHIHGIIVVVGASLVAAQGSRRRGNHKGCPYRGTGVGGRDRGVQILDNRGIRAGG